MSDNLDQITKELGTKYEVSKTAAEELKTQKGKFFKAVDAEVIATTTLATQTITVPDAEEEDPLAHIKTFYPGWRYVEEHDDGKILIEEDPGFKKFVHVNPEDGKLYRRNVSQEGPSLDDERLQKEDPTLWKRITKPGRVLKDLNTLADKDLAAVQAYFVPGKMTVKLDAPRAAKPEELGDI